MVLIQKPSDGAHKTGLNGSSAAIPKIGSLADSAQRAASTANGRYPFEGVVGDGHVLIGKGTKVTGDISNCTLVEVQGILEGSVIADTVIIRDGGGFKGVLQTDQAEVHGVLEGTAVVHELLDIRANGNVQGDLTYGRIAISEGGFVSGSLQTKNSLETAEQPNPHLTLVNGVGGAHDDH